MSGMGHKAPKMGITKDSRRALRGLACPLLPDQMTRDPVNLYSPTKTVSTDWFPVDSAEELSAYVVLSVTAEGHPNRDNSYAEALRALVVINRFHASWIAAPLMSAMGRKRTLRVRG